MRTALLFVGAAFFVATVSAPSLAQGRKDKAKWIHLLPPEDFKGWKRIPLGPKPKLRKESPWKVNTKNKTLICNGVGVWEMLLYQRPYKDGTFHVEWRFRKEAGKKTGYNGGVYVRTSPNGKQWLQAQVAWLDKTPNVGDLFGMLPSKEQDALKRTEILGTGAKHMRPVGEWNVYDIHCKGRKIVVMLNGKRVTTYINCPRRSGCIGLQAEFHYLEFRNIKWRD